MKRVLILGIGNILLRDEGIGVRAVEALQQQALPDDVELADGGTAGADLVNLVADRPKLIVVDSVDGEGPPGTIYRMNPDDLLAGPPAMSLHEFGLTDMLTMAAQMQCAPKEVVILGVKPQSMEPGLEMTEPVRNALPKLVSIVLAEAKK